MSYAIGQYIRFKTRAGSYVGKDFQNFFIEEQRSFNGAEYIYAPFIIAGSMGTKGGENPRASLITAPTSVTTNFIAEAISNYWLIDVSLVLLDRNEDNTYDEGQMLSTELWSCTGGSHDNEQLTLTLSNPLDATREQFPRRVLSSYLVGALPATGNISSV